MNAGDVIRDVLQRVASFEEEAHQILGVHEAAPSRVVQLDNTYGDLARLSLKQDELFRQALRCIEQGLYRAAHVLAWSAFMDFFEEKLAEDGLAAVRAARPNWKATDLTELREHNSEFQIVDVGRVIGLCTKNQQKALHGLLNKRNECAHPSDYYPGLNETLGFVAELFQRIDTLRAKSLP